MEFNKIVRGAKREMNDTESVNAILDAGFLCHVAFQHEGQTMMIPTAYGRLGENLYLHGSAKNFMLNQITDGQIICISVTHLDGIVLAKSLFDTSINYRSVILFGKAELITNEQERLNGLKLITENIIEGRWDEVPVGNEQQIKATMVIKFSIERASAKVRNVGPMGDEDLINEAWSGVIPLELKALQPIPDKKFGKEFDLNKSVKNYCEKNK
jgi:uncharacterized protein